MKKAMATFLAATISLSAGIQASALSAPESNVSERTFFSAEQSVSSGQTVSIAEMLSNCVNALSKNEYEIDAGLFSYAFFYGTAETYSRYTSYTKGATPASDQLKGMKTTVTPTVSKSVFGESSILRIKANSNLTLKLTSEGDEAHNYVCWSPDAYYEFIVEGTASDGKIYLISLDRRFALVKADADSYAITVTLKAGDSFLLLIGSDFNTAKSLSRWISFTASPEYNESARPDFDAMPAIVAARNEKINALHQAVEEITASPSYTKETKQAARVLLNDAGRRFFRTKSVEEVSNVYASLVASLALTKRLTPDEKERNRAFLSAFDRLSDLMVSVDRETYASVYDRIEALYEEGLEAINAADTATRVEYQYSIYQGRIRTILSTYGKGDSK